MHSHETCRSWLFSSITSNENAKFFLSTSFFWSVLHPTSLSLLRSGRAERSVCRCRWAEPRWRSGGHCRCRPRHTCWGGGPAPCAGGSSARARSSETPAPPPAGYLRCPSNAARPATGSWGARSPPPGPWSHASDLHTPPEPGMERQILTGWDLETGSLKYGITNMKFLICIRTVAVWVVS